MGSGFGSALEQTSRYHEFESGQILGSSSSSSLISLLTFDFKNGVPTYLCCLGQRWLNTEWSHCIWGCTIALYIFDMKTEVVESKCENFCSIEQKVWTSKNFYLGRFKLCTAAVDSRTLASASTTRQRTVEFEAQTSKITFFFLGNLELPRRLRQV